MDLNFLCKFIREGECDPETGGFNRQLSLNLIREEAAEAIKAYDTHGSASGEYIKECLDVAFVALGGVYKALLLRGVTKLEAERFTENLFEWLARNNCTKISNNGLEKDAVTGKVLKPAGYKKLTGYLIEGFIDTQVVAKKRETEW